MKEKPLLHSECTGSSGSHSAAQSVNPQGVSMWFETYALLSVEISATVFKPSAGFTYRKLYLTEKDPILLTWFVVRKEMNTTACFKHFLISSVQTKDNKYDSTTLSGLICLLLFL